MSTKSSSVIWEHFTINPANFVLSGSGQIVKFTIRYIPSNEDNERMTKLYCVSVTACADTHSGVLKLTVFTESGHPRARATEVQLPQSCESFSCSKFSVQIARRGTRAVSKGHSRQQPRHDDCYGESQLVGCWHTWNSHGGRVHYPPMELTGQ